MVAGAAAGVVMGAVVIAGVAAGAAGAAGVVGFAAGAAGIAAGTLAAAQGRANTLVDTILALPPSHTQLSQLPVWVANQYTTVAPFCSDSLTCVRTLLGQGIAGEIGLVGFTQQLVNTRGLLLPLINTFPPLILSLNQLPQGPLRVGLSMRANAALAAAGQLNMAITPFLGAGNAGLIQKYIMLSELVGLVQALRMSFTEVYPLFTQPVADIFTSVTSSFETEATRLLGGLGQWSGFATVRQDVNRMIVRVVALQQGISQLHALVNALPPAHAQVLVQAIATLKQKMDAVWNTAIQVHQAFAPLVP